MKTTLLIFFVILLAPVTVATQEIQKTLLISKPNIGDGRYAYVPFTVPPKTKSLTISYQYDKKGGQNTLDLGLFAPCEEKQDDKLCGFRGWSGGRRGTIFVSETIATHGYVPGEIAAGEWRVILGIYKTAPEGVEVTVKVWLNHEAAAAKAERESEAAKTFNIPKLERTLPPRSDGYTWYRGDLHTHTFHSDGNWTVNSIADYAYYNDLDFVSITEHNTHSAHAEITVLKNKHKGLMVLRGEEVTTYGGHFNVWGLPPGRLIDFRVTPGDRTMLVQSMAEVRKLGIVASINHPIALCGGCSWTYGDWTEMDSVEVWNGPWDLQDELALKQWDELLQNGKKVTAIGSSDSHSPPSEANSYSTNLAIGSPVNFAGMKKLSEQELFTAIRNGRIWVGRDPKACRLSFKIRDGNITYVIGEVVQASKLKKAAVEILAQGLHSGTKAVMIADGKIIATYEPVNGTVETSFAINPQTKYYRLEIRDDKGSMIAFTNPIFIR